MHTFEKDYWESHWQNADGESAPNPYVVAAAETLTPGTALDAGCGAGSEAIWLASRGWEVTAADISSAALALAAERAARASLAISWVEADLTSWQPERTFDLVTTSYAHPAMPQLDFYERVSRWVSPSGTLVIVAHAHDAPAETTVTVQDVTARLDPAMWRLDRAEEVARDLNNRPLRDIVVRASRI